MGIEDNLRDHLAARAAGIDPNPKDESMSSHVVGAEPPPRSSGWIAAAAAAALVVVVGGFGVLGNRGGGDLATETSFAAATTRPSTTVPGPSTTMALGASSFAGRGEMDGPTLAFEPASSIPWTFERPIVERHGQFHTVATGDRTGNDRVVSLTSEDGVTWSEIGTVFQSEPFGLTLAAGDQGLIVAGIVPEPGDAPTVFGAATGTPTVAVSINGGLWLPTPLPLDPRPGNLYSTWITAAVVAPDAAYVFGQRSLDLARLLIEAVDDEVAERARDEGYYADVRAPGGPYVLRSVAGAELASFTAQELGFSAEELDTHIRGPDPDSVLVWQSHDLNTWSLVDLDGFDAVYVDSGFHDEGAGVTRLFGQALNGSAEWTSSDGTVWERMGRPELGYATQHDGRTFAATWQAAIYEHVGADGWLPVTPQIPGGADWFFHSIDAGDSGVAALGVLHSRTGIHQGIQIEVESVEGRVVRFDENSGLYEISDGPNVIEVIAGYSPTAAQRIVSSSDGSAIEFRDGDDETLATVHIDVFSAAVDEARGENQPDTGTSHVLYSPDGSRWSLNELALPEGEVAGHVVVNGDSVVVYSQPAGMSIPFLPDRPGATMTVWVGTPES